MSPPMSLCCRGLGAPSTGLSLPPGGVRPHPEGVPHLPRGQQPGRRPPHQAGDPLELEVLAQHGTTLPSPDVQLGGQLPQLPGPTTGPGAAVTSR